MEPCGTCAAIRVGAVSALFPLNAKTRWREHSRPSAFMMRNMGVGSCRLSVCVRERELKAVGEFQKEAKLLLLFRVWAQAAGSETFIHRKGVGGASERGSRGLTKQQKWDMPGHADYSGLGLQGTIVMLKQR